MNLPFTKNSPTAPGYYVWRWDAGCPERLIKIYLHQELLLTDNAEHPKLMGGEWCELVAKDVRPARYFRTWKVGQVWMTEHEHFMKVDSVDDRGIAMLRMIAPFPTVAHSQRFIPESWTLVLQRDPSKESVNNTNAVQSGNENEVQTRKAASSQDLPAEPHITATKFLTPKEHLKYWHDLAQERIVEVARLRAELASQRAGKVEERYRETLQFIATSYPINEEPLATAHSLRAHKALCPDCQCGRCRRRKAFSKTWKVESAGAGIVSMTKEDGE